MDLQKDQNAQEVRVQTTTPKARHYKGICSAVRYAINTGKLEGKITPLKVRKILPEEKNDAPSKTIYKSLKYLCKRKEIQNHGDAYYPNSFQPPELQTQVMVTGRLIKTDNHMGRVVAHVEVDCLEIQR